MVIRFLYRHRDKLLQEGGESVEVDGTTEERDIHKSPLFAAIKRKLQKSGEEDTRALINRWHDLLTKSIEEDSYLAEQDLETQLITFLASHRYREPEDQKRISDLKSWYRDWTEVEGHLNSFRDFMKEYGVDLVGNDDLPEDSDSWVPESPQFTDDVVFEDELENASRPQKRTPFAKKNRHFLGHKL